MKQKETISFLCGVKLSLCVVRKCSHSSSGAGSSPCCTQQELDEVVSSEVFLVVWQFWINQANPEAQ